MSILEEEVRRLDVAGKPKRSEFEKSLAGMRDHILVAITSGDLGQARALLKQAQLHVESAEISGTDQRESRCRLLESELYISEIEVDARKCIQACIQKIQNSPDFEEGRRRYMMDIGLKMLSKMG